MSITLEKHNSHAIKTLGTFGFSHTLLTFQLSLPIVLVHSILFPGAYKKSVRQFLSSSM